MHNQVDLSEPVTTHLQDIAMLSAETRQLHWVENLPADFYRRASAVRVPFTPSLKAAEWLDLAIRTGLSSLITGISIPAGYSGAKLAAVLRNGSALGARSDAELFHQARPLPECVVHRIKRPFGVREGIFEQIQWHSVYRPDSRSNNASNNDWVVAWHWRHGDMPRPTVVLVHGFTAARWEVNDFFLGIRPLFQLGCDVVLKTLPHHGQRRRSAVSISGLDYVSGGIESLNHAVIQSTYDIRTLVDYLQQRAGVERVGLSGLSLGGYTSALMAGLEPRFDFVMPVVPIVSIPDAMMEWKPLDGALRNIMRKYDVSMQDLRNTMAFHSPLSRPAVQSPERLLIVAGLGDRMATPRHAEALQQHWGNCAVHWFEGSHALPLQRKRTHQAKADFLQGIGFIP